MNLAQLNERPMLAELPPGQISNIECKLLHWLASEYWTGAGEIVEVGALYGKSTVCLARGMAESGVGDKTGRLHSFDKWLADDETEYMLEQLQPKGYRGSFRCVFDDNTETYRDLIAAHEGDAAEGEWCGKPIEILFIDCSVSREFHEAMFKKFYPFLIEGALLIHQDYFLYRSYYLPLMMARLSTHFAEVGNADTSMVYQMVKPIERWLFACNIIGTDAQIIDALELRIEEFGGAQSQCGAIIASMLVYFHRIRGREQAAAEVAEKIGRSDERKWKPVMNNLKNAMAAERIAVCA